MANWRNPRPTNLQRPLLVFATDGSGQGGQAGWGLTSVRTTLGSMQADTNAGFDPGAAVREECGRVITNPDQAEHLGATRATNNTGELSAVHHALTSARELVRPGEEVLILSDSQIAICTTTGAWASRKNKALVERNRRALAALRADGTTVRFQHIRAHAGHGMNERADRLAARGAQGMRSRGGMIYNPTDGDGRGHGGGVYAPPSGPGDLPVDSVPD